MCFQGDARLFEYIPDSGNDVKNYTREIRGLTFRSAINRIDPHRFSEPH
jgi:hypothetical protein